MNIQNAIEVLNTSETHPDDCKGAAKLLQDHFHPRVCAKGRFCLQGKFYFYRVEKSTDRNGQFLKAFVNDLPVSSEVWSSKVLAIRDARQKLEMYLG